MSLAEAARVVNGHLHGEDRGFEGISTDSRTLRRGELFVALRGPRFDGHDMLAAATAAGAAGAVVEHIAAASLGQIEVRETRPALGALAREWRHRFAIPLIAVTGSAGKTTVKGMIGAIMREVGPVLVTSGNLNNDIGVPATLFRLAPEHLTAVIEMGASRPGDIALLTSIANPNVSVITLASAAHLEGFGSVETVARTKGEIISGLGEDGVAIINNEDPFAPMWRKMAAARRVVSFGSNGDVTAQRIVGDAARTTFELQCDAGSIEVVLAYQGRHNVMNALAAAAAARAVGVELEQIQRGLAAARPAAGRLQRRNGPHGACLLDDSYNANPASLKAALDVLATEPGRKWLVFGDMGELGDAAVAFHHEAGRYAAQAGVERLFTIGELARHATIAFTGEASHFSDLSALIDALRSALDGCADAPTVLIKGSRVMKLDRVADALAVTEATSC